MIRHATHTAMYTGNMRRHFNVGTFPVYQQERESTCGTSCLAMVAAWVTRRPQYESEWARLANARSTGLSAIEIMTALESKDGPLAGRIRVHLRCTAVDAPVGWRRWLRQHRDRPPITGPDRVFLVRHDAYDLKWKDQGHWIVLLDVRQRLNATCKPTWVAMVADPGQGCLWTWTWRSLVEAQVLDVIEVKKVCRR